MSHKSRIILAAGFAAVMGLSAHAQGTGSSGAASGGASGTGTAPSMAPSSGATGRATAPSMTPGSASPGVAPSNPSPSSTTSGQLPGTAGSNTRMPGTVNNQAVHTIGHSRRGESRQSKRSLAKQCAEHQRLADGYSARLAAELAPVHNRFRFRGWSKRLGRRNAADRFLCGGRLLMRR